MGELVFPDLCQLMHILVDVFMALQRKGAHLVEAKRTKLKNLHNLLKRAHRGGGGGVGGGGSH